MTTRKRPASVSVGSRTSACGTEALEVRRGSGRITLYVWKRKGTGWTHSQLLEVFPDEIAWLRHALLEAATGEDPAAKPEALEDVVLPEALPS